MIDALKRAHGGILLRIADKEQYIEDLEEVRDAMADAVCRTRAEIKEMHRTATELDREIEKAEQTMEGTDDGQD